MKFFKSTCINNYLYDKQFDLIIGQEYTITEEIYVHWGIYDNNNILHRIPYIQVKTNEPSGYIIYIDKNGKQMKQDNYVSYPKQLFLPKNIMRENKIDSILNENHQNLKTSLS